MGFMSRGGVVYELHDGKSYLYASIKRQRTLIHHVIIAGMLTPIAMSEMRSSYNNEQENSMPSVIIGKIYTCFLLFAVSSVLKAHKNTGSIIHPVAIKEI